MPLRIARISKGSQTGIRLWKVAPGGAEEREDHLATEEPLEIRLVQEGQRRTVAVTMRTPGADAELALGFLFAEGVITAREQVSRAVPCLDPEKEPAGCDNLLEVELADGVPAPELAGLDRHFFTNSACGVCGASIAATRVFTAFWTFSKARTSICRMRSRDTPNSADKSSRVAGSSARRRASKMRRSRSLSVDMARAR